MQSENQMLYPCPLSKGYGISRQQAWSILSLYFLYRIVVASLFITLFFSYMGTTLLGLYAPQLYIFSSLGYLLVSVISGVCIYFRTPDYTTQAQILIFSDIIFITILMHASGGISSGIGILLTVTTSAGALLIGGKCAMLYAAIASIAILSEQIYSSQTQTFESAYSYAGMLGASFFTIAMLSYVLAKRTERTELIIGQKERTIFQLEELNKYIIQHLQSGIIITDKNGLITMLNQSALHLLNLQAPPEDLSLISIQLNTAFKYWLNETSRDFTILTLSNHSEVHIHFKPLPTRFETFYMITLEDVAILSQRQQESKLASLGRLSASIAHEIRNPLGAISHAAQLLTETPELPPQDIRLTEIIQSHSLRVNRIIEDILQLSRKQTSTRKKIKLNSWLQDFLTKHCLENNVEPATFSLLFDPDSVYAFIDPGHLEQILGNLFRNALNYGKGNPRNPVLVKLVTRKSHPCIEVVDNGPGVDNENVDRLFEPFFTTSPTGTGLGLYISRELAELNQAQLTYDTTKNRESCFRLCFHEDDKAMLEL